MKIACDCHIHTLASGHAYSTLDECAREAARKGLELMAQTDHGPAMPGGAHPFHFMNQWVIPDHLHGVRVLRGVEANIVDQEGGLDLDDEVLAYVDLAIASLHVPCLKPGTMAENTRALIGAMKRPRVSVIGHPDDGRYPLDPDELCRAASDAGVMLEVNNSSLRPGSWREGADTHYRRLFEAAVRHGTWLVVNSDAHFHADVGNCTAALDLLDAWGFPEAQVASVSAARLLEVLARRLGPAPVRKPQEAAR